MRKQTLRKMLSVLIVGAMTVSSVPAISAASEAWEGYGN